jgi:membrane protein
MSHEYDVVPGAPDRVADESTGQLIARFSQDLSELVRNELRLAQLEIAGKAKRAGVGVGMFGAAGVIALYGLGALIAAAILALALAVSPWSAALIVGCVLLATAGVAALLGKKRVTAASPPMPERAMDNLKRDVDAVRRQRG